MKILDKVFQLEYNDEDLFRVGPQSDGGYVVNKSALDEAEVLYTYGVENEYRFEEQFLSLYPNKNVKMFDHTVNDPSHGKLNNCKFVKEALKVDNDGDFNSFEDHLIRFKDINKKVFLKVDVESYEYEFFRDIEKKDYLFKNITGMVFEFHELNNYIKFLEFCLILNYLRKYFYITHVHANNHTGIIDLQGELLPQTVEVSFRSRKTNIKFERLSNVNFPKTGLDFPNAKNVGDISFII